MKCMKIIALEEHYRMNAIEKAEEKPVPRNIYPWMFRPGRRTAKGCGMPIIVALILSGVFFATTGWQRPVCEELEGVLI